MRTLSSNEINGVSGAGYSEDIMTAAASIYVGSFIGRTAAGLSAGAFAAAGKVLGLSTIGSVVGTVGAMVTPASYLVAPFIVFEAVYPGVMAKKAESYFS